MKSATSARTRKLKLKSRKGADVGEMCAAPPQNCISISTFPTRTACALFVLTAVSAVNAQEKVGEDHLVTRAVEVRKELGLFVLLSSFSICIVVKAAHVF